MHKAFETAVVVDRLPTRALGSIESVASHSGNKLLLGTAKGQLLQYSLNAQGTGKEDLTVRLLDTKRSFAKRAITQLECIPELNLLLSLSDGFVMVHDLHSLAERSQITRTRGTMQFAISLTMDDTKGMQPPHPILRLCCIMKKQLLVLHWTGSDFVERKLFPMPDTPKQVVWCRDSIFVGFRREYYLLDTARGTTRVLFPTGRDMVPLMMRVDDNEVLLNKDNVSIFIGNDGRPTRRFGIVWNLSPSAMVIVSGFCLGLLPKAIEIRSIETQALVQTIEMASPKIIANAKSLSPKLILESAFLCNEAGGVYGLLPVPLNMQVEDLVEANEYDDALLLAERLPEGASQLNKIQGIKLLQAFHLFETGRYEDSLDLFAQLDTDPPIVIGLYPNLLPNSLRDEIVPTFPIRVPTLEGKELHVALTALINFLSLKRDRLERRFLEGLPQADGVKELWQIIDTTLLKCFLSVSPIRLPRLLRRPNHCHLKECEKMLKQGKRVNELVMLYQYKGMDIKALEFLRSEADVEASPLFSIHPIIEYLQTLTSERIGLVIKYSTWPLQTNPKESLKIFTEGRTEEVKPTVTNDYSLTNENENQTACAASNVVIHRVREQTVQHIMQHGQEVVPDYLEHLIYIKKETWPKYHNQLVTIYLDCLRDLWEDYKASGMDINSPAGTVREKLAELLKFSALYDAESLLSDPLFEDLLEERAILMGRIGRHEDVLKLLAYKLKDTEKALDYCTKLYQNGCEGKLLYQMLLKIYLSYEQRDGENHQIVPMIEPALTLLTKHGDKIDTIEALNALPRDCHLASVYPLLGSMMQSTAKSWRSNLLIKNLAKAQHLKEQEELYQYRGRATLVSESRTCPVCNKRLGMSALAFCPNGTVVHYGCLDTQ
eukprot:CFRG6038T1